MLTRALPIPTLELGDGTKISLSIKVCSKIAQMAIEKARSLEPKVQSAEEPLAIVKDVHEDWSILKNLVPQIEEHVRQLDSAANALNGEVVLGSGEACSSDDRIFS